MGTANGKRSPVWQLQLSSLDRLDDLEIHGIAAVADHKIRRKLFQESLDFLGSLEGFTGSEKEGISKIFFHILYFMDVHLLQALFCPEIQVLFLNF